MIEKEKNVCINANIISFTANFFFPFCIFMTFWETRSKIKKFIYLAFGEKNKLTNYFGGSTLVGQCPMKSLSSVRLSVCLSVRPSVTKVSQDWIISFFWYCTLYLVTDKARSLKKKCGGPSFRPTGLNQVQNEIFRLSFQICIVSFLDISQDCSLGWSLTSSRDETSKKIVAQIRA